MSAYKWNKIFSTTLLQGLHINSVCYLLSDTTTVLFMFNLYPNVWLFPKDGLLKRNHWIFKVLDIYIAKIFHRMVLWILCLAFHNYLLEVNSGCSHFWIKSFQFPKRYMMSSRKLHVWVSIYLICVWLCFYILLHSFCSCSFFILNGSFVFCMILSVLYNLGILIFSLFGF